MAVLSGNYYEAENILLQVKQSWERQTQGRIQKFIGDV